MHRSLQLAALVAFVLGCGPPEPAPAPTPAPPPAPAPAPTPAFEPPEPPEPPEPAEPPEPPEILELEGKIRITEEGIFGPGLMITEDGIVAPGVNISREGLVVLAGKDGPGFELTREKLEDLGKTLKSLVDRKDLDDLKDLAIEVTDKHVKVGELVIPLRDGDVDVHALVLKALHDDDEHDHAGASRTSCAEGDCDMPCAAGTTCKASCAGGGCRQTCADKATCSFSCAGGDCFQRCEGSATCKLSCSGGDCRRSCAKTATCATTCSGDDCTADP